MLTYKARCKALNRIDCRFLLLSVSFSYLHHKRHNLVTVFEEPEYNNKRQALCQENIKIYENLRLFETQNINPYSMNKRKHLIPT